MLKFYDKIDAECQCEIKKYTLEPYLASLFEVNFVKLPDVKHKCKEINKKFCDNSVQTLDTLNFQNNGKRSVNLYSKYKINNKNDDEYFEVDNQNEKIEIKCKNAIQKFQNLAKNVKKELNSDDLMRFDHFLKLLSAETIVYLSSNTMLTIDFLKQIENLIKLNDYQTKLFDLIILKIKNNSKEIQKYLKISLGSIDFKYSIFFDSFNHNSPTLTLNCIIDYIKNSSSGKSEKILKYLFNSEKRRVCLDRFRRIVRFVIINSEWLKYVNKSRNNENYNELLLQYRDYEHDRIELNCKRALLLFDKDQYKSQRYLIILTKLHRNILSKFPYLRTIDDLKQLEKLITNVSQFKIFHKYIREHIAKLLQLITYEKGREIIREGHRAIGFYIIISIITIINYI